MNAYPLNRELLLNLLSNTLEPQAYALAMWEGGAAGFDRVDQWSDADVQVIVKDGFVEQAFEDLEAALAQVTETDYRHRLPEPTWHGHSQCFYRFQQASPYLMLDLLIIQESSQADRFMQFRTHGTPQVLFDKANLIQEEALDVEGMLAGMQRAVESARMRHDLFWILTSKEIHRGNRIEAIAFYQNYVLTPLLEVLRIRCCPARYMYRTRYAHYDLPQEVADRLAEFYYVKDLADLQEKHTAARAWFYEEVNELDWDQVKQALL